MKLKYCHPLLAGLLTCSFLFAESKLEYWTFDTDSVGASFDNGSGGFLNSGSNANSWNHGKVKGIEADGVGHLVIANADSKYRRVPAQDYAPGAYSSGRYRLVIEFVSWSLDPVNDGSLAFEVSDSKNRRIAGLNLYADQGTDAKIRFSATSATGWQGKGFDYAGYMANLKENRPMRLSIDFDLDNDTVTYFVNGTAIKTIPDFNASSIAQIKFFTDSKWSKQSTVKIKEMGFIKLPKVAPPAGISL
jgi:hypothetical protein